MPELTEEQIETVKQLLHRVTVLEETELPKLETQHMSANDIINNLARRLHTVEISTQTIINNCQQQVADLGAEIHTYMAENYQNKASSQQNNSIRIKAPAPFSGQTSYIDSFFTQLSVVFAADETRFFEDEKKVLHTIGCLTGNALAYIEPYIKEIENNKQLEILKDYKNFKQLLYDAFGDSNPIINSEASIRALRQVGSVTRYSTEFRRLSMQLTWNNDALVSQFILNLKEHVKDELARLAPINDLNAVIAKSIEIDNRQFSRMQHKQQINRNPRPQQPTPMEINNVGQPTYEVSYGSNNPFFSPNQSNTQSNNNNNRRGPITPEEKD